MVTSISTLKIISYKRFKDNLALRYVWDQHSIQYSHNYLHSIGLCASQAVCIPDQVSGFGMGQDDSDDAREVPSLRPLL
ncbi:MAG: hypothetical protein ACYTGH_13775, partial [Planctomycetota bacterium]